MNHDQSGNIIIYRSDDGISKIDVHLEDENVWLSQQQMAELYQSSRSNVVEHIKNIYNEGELDKNSTCRNFRQVRLEGNRNVEREIPFYNLDMIISLGYRIKSKLATQFRIWATKLLKEYIVKGFTMNDEHLKNLGGGNYWKELLDRIRDIRSSEKVMYRQVLELYTTAIDYDPKSDDSTAFFKIVQNKLHFAAHGNTASEVIYYRVDSNKPFAGLTNFKGKEPIQAELMIAKNYLSEKELKVLNNLVSAYFDLAELNAIEKREMRMSDFVRELDTILSSTGRKLLENAGSVSSIKAKEKAKGEYNKYKTKKLESVEKDYLKTINALERQAKVKSRKKGK